MTIKGNYYNSCIIYWFSFFYSSRLTKRDYFSKLVNIFDNKFCMHEMRTAQLTGIKARKAFVAELLKYGSASFHL